MSLTRWGPPRPPNGADADALFLRYWLFWVTLGGAVGALAPAVAQLVLAGAPVRAPLVIGAGAVIKKGAKVIDSVVWAGQRVLADAKLDRCIVCSGTPVSGEHSNADL